MATIDLPDGLSRKGITIREAIVKACALRTTTVSLSAYDTNAPVKKDESLTLLLKVSPQVMRLLQDLRATGFYGIDVPSTAEELLLSKVRDEMEFLNVSRRR